MSAPSDDARPARRFWSSIALAIVVAISLVVASGPALQPTIIPGRTLLLPATLGCQLAALGGHRLGGDGKLGAGKRRLRKPLLFAFGLRLVLSLWHHGSTGNRVFDYRVRLNGLTPSSIRIWLSSWPSPD